MSGYLSRPDRRLEHEAAEERVSGRIEFTVSFQRGPCPWCLHSVDRHSAEALTRCEHAFESELNRRREVEARKERRLCRTCGQVHGPGACP